MRLSLVRGPVPLSALALAAAVLVTACGGGSSGNGSQGGGGSGTPDPQLSYKADIRRTGMGVPHIKADNWGGARYGLQTMCEGGGMANVTIVERL